MAPGYEYLDVTGDFNCLSFIWYTNQQSCWNCEVEMIQNLTITPKSTLKKKNSEMLFVTLK